MTFDGVTPSNGFHPLYLILLLPILAASGADLIAPIHASAILLSAVAVLTGLLIFRLTRRLAGPVAALIALAVWAVSPYFTVLGINGLETGLAMLFAVAALAPYSSGSGSRAPLPAAGARRRSASSSGWRRWPGSTCCCCWPRSGSTGCWSPPGSGDCAPRSAGSRSRPRWRSRSGYRGESSAARKPAPGFRRADPPPARSRSPMAGWTCRRSGRPSGFAQPGASPFFDPDRVPAAYYADAATQQLFVFLLEHPLLAALRVHLPYSVWSQLERYPPHAAFRAFAMDRSDARGAPAGRGDRGASAGLRRLARGSGHRRAGGRLSAADLPRLHFLLSRSLVLLALPDPGGPRHAAVRRLRAARDAAAPLAPGRRGSGGRRSPGSCCCSRGRSRSRPAPPSRVSVGPEPSRADSFGAGRPSRAGSPPPRRSARSRREPSAGSASATSSTSTER